MCGDQRPLVWSHYATDSGVNSSNEVEKSAVATSGQSRTPAEASSHAVSDTWASSVLPPLEIVTQKGSSDALCGGSRERCKHDLNQVVFTPFVLC
jgi:hypothetical protein